MTACLHCGGADATCLFCLGGGPCGAHTTLEECRAAAREAASSGVPDADRPSTETLLHTDQVSGSLALWLVDATPCTPEDDILAVKARDRQRMVSGTGAELADVAVAVLRHVLPSDCRRIARSLRIEAEGAYSNSEHEAGHALANWIDPLPQPAEPAPHAGRDAKGVAERLHDAAVRVHRADPAAYRAIEEDHGGPGALNPEGAELAVWCAANPAEAAAFLRELLRYDVVFRADGARAETDLQRLEAHLKQGGASALYEAIRLMGAGMPCPDPEGRDAT